MGQRANLIVVNETDYELYYSHWRANLLDRDLFWGPQHALAFIRQQRSRAEGAGWLDDVWAEGGALMDLSRSHLLWWGGSNVDLDIPSRRIHSELMAVVWRGWDISWAHEGIVDLARYVGIPKSDVLTEVDEDEIGTPDLSLPEEKRWLSSVLSVRFAGGKIALFPLERYIESMLWRCDELAALAAKTDSYEHLDLAEWRESVPTCGAHMDTADKRVELWSAHVQSDIEARLSAANPGWKIVWNRDRFESQLEAAPHLRFPALNQEKIIDDLQSSLLHAGFDYTNYIVDVSQKVHPGQKIEVNPFALRDDPLPLDAEERQRIWTDAVNEWRSR